MKNYYKILCVGQTATDDEIKRSYRVLAKKYHPDIHPDDKTAADKFADVSEAYDTLSDPKKRAEYDKKLKEAANPKRPEDIIARQRAAAQAAARQAAMRNAFSGGRIDPITVVQARAQAQAQAAQAQAQAQAAAQAQINAVKSQAYKNGYDVGYEESKAKSDKEISRLKSTVSKLEDELKSVRKKLDEVERDRSELEQELFNRDRELDEVERDRSELEQELFNRDRELTQEKAKTAELEKQIEAADKSIAGTRRASEEKSAAAKNELAQAKDVIKQLELENREAELKNVAQIELQQERRKQMQSEIDGLRMKIIDLNEELEELRNENEQWRQYASSEDFISDAEKRLQEWDKKQKADKKLAKNTLYGVLGVLIWSTDEEIEAAYKKLSKRYSVKNDAAYTEKLEHINEAYAILSDPEKRREYNGTIDISDERIAEERRLIEENEKMESEYRSQLESKEFWAKFDELTFNAQTGDADSQNTLGEMYYYGDEIEQDISQAVYWFKEAAKQKHPDAMYNLGVCFINGEGVDANNVTGLSFIKQAARLGSKPAGEYLAAEDKK